MNRFRALLHLLLCLCLVLNGSGHALAGDALHAQPHAEEATQVAQAMSEDCEASMQHEPAAGHDAAGDPAHATGMHAPGTDCCDSGNACDCACQQHSPASLAALLVFTAVAIRSQAPGVVEASPASPLPQRLIRPPIA